MSDTENNNHGGDPVGFARQVLPLFRDSDRESMSDYFDLWAYDDVVENSAAIASRLHEGSMPCDGSWPPEQVDVFDRWVRGGFAP